MAKSNTQIIEVNGIKMEVDLRQARRIDTFKVGDRVKILVKDYSTTVYHGVVAGFDAFKEMPTIIVAYLNVDYSSAELKFAYVNTKNAEKYEIVADRDDAIPVEKADIMRKFDRDLEKRHAEIEDIEMKRKYFMTMFGQHFPSEEEMS